MGTGDDRRTRAVTPLNEVYRGSTSEVRRRALLPFAPELSRSEAFFQDARELLCLHSELCADLLGPKAVTVLFHEGHDRIEDLGNVFRRAPREPAAAR